MTYTITVAQTEDGEYTAYGSQFEEYGVRGWGDSPEEALSSFFRGALLLLQTLEKDGEYFD